MRVRILGCGTSSGVPRIGNDWGDCDPADPRNRRSRASIIVETDATRILIDTGPDLREQLLAAEVADIDAVIWTHDHADHCHGIDDLRQLFHARGRPVQAYARPETRAVLAERFAYAFAGRDGYPPIADCMDLPIRLTVGDMQITTVDQPHGSISSVGIKIENGGRSVIYATDFNEMTADMATLYGDADVWVVDALRRRPHPTHPHLAQALGWIADLSPSRAFLTHMDQSMDYATLCAELPAHIRPCHDGMIIAV